MKRLKKRLFSGIMSVVLMCSLCCFSQATSVETIDYEENLYNYLMGLPRATFVEAIRDICNEENYSNAMVAGAALRNRTDVSDSDLAQMAANNNNTYLLRRIALESYNLRDPEIVSEEIIAIMADSCELTDLRTYAVATLGDKLDKSYATVLVEAANSGNEDLAYNALKVLEHVDHQKAISIAQDIYDNYNEETPARINIASKILSNMIGNANVGVRNIITAEMFVEKSEEIFAKSDNVEVRQAIGNSVSAITIDNEYFMAAMPRATGFQGYAAYRDGVTGDGGLDQWHAAIIYGPATSMAYYIFGQASGPSYTTDLVSYPEFIVDGSPLGYYRPSSTNLTSAQRDAVCATTLNLANAHIPYSLITPIVYTTESNAGGKYPISSIEAIRCDGFVEYAYEYNDIRVFGTSVYWDISKQNYLCQREHLNFSMTPRTQAQQSMTRIGSL